MKYPELILDLCNKTGIPRKHIRLVLDALPEALLELRVGEKVQTPFGTFIARHRKKRAIKLPDGVGMGEVPEQVSIQLKISNRMRVSPDDPLWDHMVGEDS
jgi:nucleoid DNA-binding protein